jgi:uncharacterized sulfatase
MTEMNSDLNRRRFLRVASAVPLGASMRTFGRSSPQPARRAPNFIVLFADDMGYGDLTCYGHPTIRTPNLDRMAGQGVRFTSFYAAAPFCTPSRAGLLTGRYPVRAGQPNNLGPDSVGGLPLSEITLAQLLKNRGYKTRAIGKWHLGHNPKEYLPTSRGFDSYYGLLYSNDMIPPWVKTTTPLELYRDTEPIEHPVDQSTLTERYTREAKRFIRSAGRNPFFLYLPYSTLEEEGLDGNTMVVFTSDNGPWLDLPARMLQKGNEPWHGGAKGLLRGHKGNTYEGGIRVPCIARWPGVIPQRQINSDIACTLDLFTTIARASGAPLPEDRVYDGLDVLPLMQGTANSPRTLFYYFRGRVLEAVREGNWKCRFARHTRDDLKAGEPITPELFDLDVDPAERYNVYERNRELGDRLLKRLRVFAEDLSADLAS